MTDRPSVSVIVPFAGPRAALEQLVSRLAQLQLRDGDEVIVADNRGSGLTATPGARARVIAAAGINTPAFARNRAADAARGEWLVFIDADTVPAASLLDDYFEPAPDSRTGILAGGIRDIATNSSLVARRAVVREQMSERATVARPRWRYAQTANCAVRRTAFDVVGGFVEEARAGEDADLCFRLERAGWMLEPRPQAAVAHSSRGTVGALVRQLMLHGSGAAWLERLYPGAMPRPGARAFTARWLAGAREAVRAAASGDRGAAGLAALDLLATSAFELGRLVPNRRGRRRVSPQRSLERGEIDESSDDRAAGGH